MPRRNFIWRHVTISTHNSWLHGDDRGFRDRYHRLHSSGDYRNPPPKGEHESVYRFYKSRAGDEVTIDKTLRAIIGRAALLAARELGIQVLAVAVTKVHLHLLAELPKDPAETKQLVGEIKRKSSRAVRRWLPGSVWSAGGSYKPVRDRQHHQTVFGYILYKQGLSAWTWSFRDRSDEGCFGRQRTGPPLRSGPA